MSVKDFIKSSILSQFQTGSVDYAHIAVAIAAALLLGLFIYFIYSKFYGGVVYSRSFAITLVGMSVLTCMVTLAISTNVVISLGMVGSLSIIRYRTAVKSPLDLLYMFWAVTVGITVGAGLYFLAIIVSVVMFVIVLVFAVKPKTGCVYVAVIHYVGDTAEEEVMRALGRGKYSVKSKTMYKDRTELAVEIFCRSKQLASYEKLRDIEGVEDVTFVQYNGEYNG